MNIAGVESTPARPPTAARRHRTTGRARVEILFILIFTFGAGRASEAAAAPPGRDFICPLNKLCKENFLIKLSRNRILRWIYSVLSFGRTNRTLAGIESDDRSSVF